MKRFTDQDLIERLRTLRDRVGRTPTHDDTYDYPDIPGHMVYVRRFGTWRKALETAGIPINPRNHGYDRETLLQELRDIIKQLGRTPVGRELPALGGAHANTYASHFGTWSAALRELGLEPRSTRWYETEELLDMLRGLANELGHSPSVSELQSRSDLPSPQTVRNRFGTWNKALRAAGLTPRYPTPGAGGSD